MIKLLLISLAGMGIFVLLPFRAPVTEKYLSHNDVRGIDFEHDGKLWTLNFDQQTQVITALNNSSPSTRKPFGRLIIYRFGEPDLIIQEQTAEIQNILSQTYDQTP